MFIHTITACQSCYQEVIYLAVLTAEESTISFIGLPDTVCQGRYKASCVESCVKIRWIRRLFPESMVVECLRDLCYNLPPNDQLFLLLDFFPNVMVASTTVKFEERLYYSVIYLTGTVPDMPPWHPRRTISQFSGNVSMQHF